MLNQTYVLGLSPNYISHPYTSTDLIVGMLVLTILSIVFLIFFAFTFSACRKALKPIATGYTNISQLLYVWCFKQNCITICREKHDITIDLKQHLYVYACVCVFILISCIVHTYFVFFQSVIVLLNYLYNTLRQHWYISGWGKGRDL